MKTYRWGNVMKSEHGYTVEAYEMSRPLSAMVVTLEQVDECIKSLGIDQIVADEREASDDCSM